MANATNQFFDAFIVHSFMNSNPGVEFEIPVSDQF